MKNRENEWQHFRQDCDLKFHKRFHPSSLSVESGASSNVPSSTIRPHVCTLSTSVSREMHENPFILRPETLVDPAYTIMLIVPRDLLALYLLVQEVKTVIKDTYCVKRSLIMAKLSYRINKWKTTRDRAATFLNENHISILEETRIEITT